MAEYTGTVDTTMSPEEAFDYMAEFSHTSEWDPNCETAERTTPDPLGVGSRFDLKFSGIAGKQLELGYEMKEFERPSRFVLEADEDHVRSLDTIEITPKGSGATVTYNAQLELKGAFKLADPILGMGLSKAGSEARDCLERKLNP